MSWRLLTGLPEDEMQAIVATAVRRRFDRGEVVFHRGDPGETVHLVAKGRFAAQIVTPLGDTAILAVVGPGELFGELALLVPDHARTATVIALERAETLSIHRADFDALRRRHPPATENLLAVLSTYVQRLSSHLVEALYVPADRRVLRRLLELTRVYGDEIPLTQDDLAGMAGTSRGTVNKVLRAAQDRGELRLERGRTVVIGADELARRAGRP